jgi:hypothetical protein
LSASAASTTSNPLSRIISAALIRCRNSSSTMKTMGRLTVVAAAARLRFAHRTAAKALS